MKKDSYKISNKKFISNFVVPFFILSDDFNKDLSNKNSRSGAEHNNFVFLSNVKNFIFHNKKIKLGCKYKNKIIEDKEVGVINNFLLDF